MTPSFILYTVTIVIHKSLCIWMICDYMQTVCICWCVCGCLQTPFTYWVAAQVWGKSYMWVISFILSHFKYKLQTNRAGLNQCHYIYMCIVTKNTEEI